MSGTSITLPKDDKIYFEGIELKRGQLGVLTIEKPIKNYGREMKIIV